MTDLPKYFIALFESVNQTMWATRILKEGGIPHKLVPVPRHISSDCGVCIRIEPSLVDAAREKLSGIEGFIGIVPL